VRGKNAVKRGKIREKKGRGIINQTITVKGINHHDLPDYRKRGGSQGLNRKKKG